MIACIACGGFFEVTLIACGLSALIGWIKKRHNKNKCKCCKSKEETKDKK